MDIISAAIYLLIVALGIVLGLKYVFPYIVDTIFESWAVYRYNCDRWKKEDERRGEWNDGDT